MIYRVIDNAYFNKKTSSPYLLTILYYIVILSLYKALFKYA
jgi:hypothetical protein